jgi:hypothetical protein
MSLHRNLEMYDGALAAGGADQELAVRLAPQLAPVPTHASHPALSQTRDK